jgi:Periplasmic copper-binding protein (NosD)
MIISLVVTPSVFAQQKPGSVSNNSNNTLKILSHNSFIDSAGYFHVVGEVENVSPNNVESVKVIGTFYDADSKVVGTDFTFTNPTKLSAGDKAPFELILTSASIPVKEIDNYRLSLDWQKGGGEAATTVLPSEFGLNNIVIGNENFVEKTGSDTVDCGEKVRGTIILTANLTCSNHGLIVGNNTVVNMNGYSIRGPGQESSKVGIMISNNDNVVVVGPGDISNFQAGILVTSANHVRINSTILEKNKMGVYTQNSNYLQIVQNIIKDNELGITSNSDNNINITSNLLNGNALAGVTFVITHDSTVFQNNIDGSQNGIFADAQSSGNTVSMNNVLHNVIDLNNANGLPTNMNSNSYTNNNCQVSNPRGQC